MAYQYVGIPMAVGSRIGPWLSRMGSAAWAEAQSLLTKAGITGLRSVDDLVNYVKNNKMATANVLSTLALGGFAVSDLFSPDDKKDPETRAFVANLANMELAKMEQRFIDVASESEELSGLAGNASDLRTLKEICAWAKAHYGSKDAARKAFLRHQAFFELSKEDLDVGMELLV